MLLVSDQGMDIALGRIGFAGIDDNEEATEAGETQPKRNRVSLWATGGKDH